MITYMEGSLGPKLTELNTAILLQESRFRHEHPVSVFITCVMYQQVDECVTCVMYQQMYECVTCVMYQQV